MTRAELVNLLADLVLRLVITEDEARELLVQFDRGEWVDLPAPLAEAIAPATQEEGDNAWLFALGLIGLGAALQADAARQARRQIDERNAVAARNRMRTAFEEEMQRLARQAAGNGDIIAWQRQMNDAVSRYMLGQAQAGRGRPLTGAEIAELSRQIQEQRAYVYRYAGEIAARRANGDPFGEAYLLNRNTQYGGAGWGLWFRGAEADVEPGWVVDYVARDDSRTCSPCLNAERNGPYLPGQGVFPGEVCLGRGFCRCERRRRYAPDEYRRLRGL